MLQPEELVSPTMLEHRVDWLRNQVMNTKKLAIMSSVIASDDRKIECSLLENGKAIWLALKSSDEEEEIEVLF